MPFIDLVGAGFREELRPNPKGIAQSVWSPTAIMANRQVSRNRESLELSYKTRDGYFVNSNDIIVNPGIWGATDYRARLAAHKRALKAPAQDNVASPAAEYVTGDATVPCFEGSIAGFPARSGISCSFGLRKPIPMFTYSRLPHGGVLQ
ncbi:hypothetical protein O1611_g6937 [Lasiodiplodia mahajangana]|uniref:Uncharacterized protein n=1 Tax=Lasiodiplodia mahajangana TaxID=1108764 RepID=A0ACC2JHB9_9PEZI|nr:hypothetical protein O1611_g6937 [Lasiodiplodia mahajangana]